MKSRELLGQMAQAGERIRNVDLTGAEGELMARTMHTSDGDDFWEEHYGQLLEKVRGGIYPATMDFKTVLQYTEGTDVLTDGILVTARGEKKTSGGCLRIFFCGRCGRTVLDGHVSVIGRVCPWRHGAGMPEHRRGILESERGPDGDRRAFTCDMEVYGRKSGEIPGTEDHSPFRGKRADWMR